MTKKEKIERLKRGIKRIEKMQGRAMGGIFSREFRLKSLEGAKKALARLEENKDDDRL